MRQIITKLPLRTEIVRYNFIINNSKKNNHSPKRCVFCGRALYVSNKSNVCSNCTNKYKDKKWFKEDIIIMKTIELGLGNC